MDHPEVEYNQYMKSVILKEVSKRWHDFWTAWPIPFVLFDDFCQRYPDSTFYHEAEDYLIEYTKYEIIRLQLRGDLFHEGEDKRRSLIHQLYEYLQQNFPDSITPQMKKDARRYQKKI